MNGPPAIGGRPCLAPVARIQREVARHFRIPRRLMTSRELARPAPTARHVAMFLASAMLGKGPTEIGRRFNRDHSTVRHGIRSVSNNPELASVASVIRERLEQ